jgi:hypothetical protein
MPIDTAVLVAALTGLLGALVVTGIGLRFTRNLRALTCSGIFSAAALGALMYVLCRWFTRGFVLFEISVPALSVLILLLVMTAQNWFVFYQDRRDVVQSSRPVLVMLATAAAALLARMAAGRHSNLLPLIWAGGTSLAILSCVDPVQRSIERARSVPAGTVIGIGKILIPLTGVVLFLRHGDSAAAERPEADEPDCFAQKRILKNLAGLIWDLGQIVLLILINGARVPHPAAGFTTPSFATEASRLKRDSVVMIFVLAIHVLCGVVLARA